MKLTCQMLNNYVVLEHFVAVSSIGHERRHRDLVHLFIFDFSHCRDSAFDATGVQASHPRPRRARDVEDDVESLKENGSDELES